MIFDRWQRHAKDCALELKGKRGIFFGCKDRDDHGKEGEHSISVNLNYGIFSHERNATIVNMMILAGYSQESRN